MKFDYSAVEDCIEKIEKELNNINNALDDIREGLDFMTGKDNWVSEACDYLISECREVYLSITNVSYVSTNVNSYLRGILENYKPFNTSSSPFSFFGW